MKNLLRSFFHAFCGLFYAFRTEYNMRIHLGAAILVLLMAWYFKLDKIEFLLVTAAIFLVFIAEILNTALEKVVDLITKEFNPLARVAKNLSAAAVLITSLLALVIGIVIFGGHIYNFLIYYFIH